MEEGGGSKIAKYCVTSFMDDPKVELRRRSSINDVTYILTLLSCRYVQNLDVIYGCNKSWFKLQFLSLSISKCLNFYKIATLHTNALIWKWLKYLKTHEGSKSKIPYLMLKFVWSASPVVWSGKNSWPNNCYSLSNQREMVLKQFS